MNFDIVGISISTAVPIALLLIFHRILSSRVRGGCLKVLWGMILARLLLPVRLPFEKALAELIPVKRSPVIYETTAASAVSHNDAVMTAAVTAVWLFGAVFTAAYIFFTAVKTRRKFSCAVSANADRKVIKTLRKVRIKYSDLALSPFTYGILSPVVILPKKLYEEGGKPLEYSLCHEFVHIKGFDMLFKAALSAAAAVYWFDPLVWAMVFRADKDLELACDERVIAYLGAKERRGYAMTIIGLEEKRAFGICSMSAANAEERIKAVMTKDSAKKIFPSIIAVTAAAALMLLFNFNTTRKMTAVETAAAEEVSLAVYEGTEEVSDAVYEYEASREVSDEIYEVAAEAPVSAAVTVTYYDEDSTKPMYYEYTMPDDPLVADEAAEVKLYRYVEYTDSVVTVTSDNIPKYVTVKASP